MRFLVDECTGPTLARWLRDQGHEVFSVYDQARGSDDETLMRKAYDENWIIITNDKDFGEKVYREKSAHKGIVFLRLEDERSAIKIEVIRTLLAAYADRLPRSFVVVSETRIRFAQTLSGS